MFKVVESEIWAQDGEVYTLEEAEKMLVELKTCIAEIKTRLTKRAADGGNAAPEFSNFE